MTLTLNVVQVLDLARQAVNIRGEQHVQQTCKYLTVTETQDGLVYKAECFVGMILFLLVGADTFIKAALPTYAAGSYQAGDGVNGACDSMAFTGLAERAGVTITPEARNLLNFMQKAQDGGLINQENEPWGRVLGYASGMVDTFDLIRVEENNTAAAERAAVVKKAEAEGVSVQDLLALARNNQEVKDFIDSSQIIQAIKTLRSQGHTHFGVIPGLLEAKRAVEALRDERQPF